VLIERNENLLSRFVNDYTEHKIFGVLEPFIVTELMEQTFGPG
jgi:hypothetical protein